MQSNRFLCSIGNGCNLHDGPTDMPHLFLRRKVESTVPELSCPCENTHTVTRRWCSSMRIWATSLIQSLAMDTGRTGHTQTVHATLAISEWPGGWIPAKNKLLKLLKGLLTALEGFKSCSSTSTVKLGFSHISRSSVPPSSSIFLSDHLPLMDPLMPFLLWLLLLKLLIVAALLLPCCCRCCHAWGHRHRNCASCYYSCYPSGVPNVGTLAIWCCIMLHCASITIGVFVILFWLLAVVLLVAELLLPPIPEKRRNLGMQCSLLQ